MRLLMLNGNTNTAMTDAMASRARAFLGSAVAIRAETVGQGVPYIASRRDCALAGAGLVASLEGRSAADHDAVLLACFGEPGLAAVREVSPVPVTGMLEASVLSAMQLGARFSIITPGMRWPRMIEDALHQLGATRHCLGITPVVIDDLALPEQRGQARARVQAAVADQQARLAPDAIIVGGAAFAGLTDELEVPSEVRLVDSLDAALAQSLALMYLTRAQATCK
ncbi:aspartate/glutamate racemase family protein [Halomonas sp. M4R1S46]|uniref:aspartate/glutamate racemase family protein n=1 Tax=Halomonas sp. M4R1S46 TaxID=2982692 RepID=UPI0021E40D4E|nr:aspartate/glutamate racemase family protein [Halomonas sp. M4R1S46]UYG07020.1 aspartate/glutamate racemase family protein [Halomonas sp. M4R1S46]